MNESPERLMSAAILVDRAHDVLDRLNDEIELYDNDGRPITDLLCDLRGIRDWLRNTSDAMRRDAQPKPTGPFYCSCGATELPDGSCSDAECPRGWNSA